MKVKTLLLVVLTIGIVVVVLRSRLDMDSRPTAVANPVAQQWVPSDEQREVEAPAAPQAIAPAAEPVEVAPTTPAGKSVLQRIAENDTSVFKLTPEQVQAHLTRNQTNAESLLAAFNVSNDKEFLREALRRYPGDPFVLASVLANNASPENRRELLEQLKQASANNPLANYWLARDYLKEKQPDLALKEFADAYAKTGFHDFSVERIQGLEEMYLGAGYSAAEAKALAMSSVQLPAMSHLRELGREMAGIGRQYVAAGDAASAESLARMGLSMAANLRTAGANSLLGQIVSTVVEREFLNGLDPNANYDFISQPVPTRLAELQAEDRSIRDAARFYDGWVRAATEAQLVSYFDRLKLYGESSALVWARTQTPAP